MATLGVMQLRGAADMVAGPPQPGDRRAQESGDVLGREVRNRAGLVILMMPAA